MNTYRKPPLQLEYWCVSRKDLYMVYNFFRERFGTDKVAILVETKAGYNRAYSDFEEFAEDIEVVLAANDTVQKIILTNNDLGPHARRYIWFTAEFLFGSARFTLSASDDDASLKAWADDTYKEMEKLFTLFRPNDAFIEILKRDFLRTYPERRRSNGHGVVVLDYDGNIQDRIHKELASPPEDRTPVAAHPFPKGAWLKDKRIVAGLAGSLLLLALILMSFWMK
jgi:hypothetical protein